MKFRYLFLLTVIILSVAISSNAKDQTFSVTKNLTSMPLTFTENQGQWDEQVQFRTNAGGAMMWFTNDGAVYQFTRTIESDNNPISVIDKRYSMMPDDISERPENRQGLSTSAPNLMHHSDSTESITIKANFVGANPNPQMVGLEEMEYKCNYFIGNDPDEWHTNVPNYHAIVYEEIYEGIDLKYYGNGTQMEYDFIVSPGADPSQVSIQYEGAESIAVNANGELVVETKWGEVVENHPVIYQIDNDSRFEVEGEYILTGANSFGFTLSSDYDPTLPLVIDPVLEYSTYLGGVDGEEYGYGIAVDSYGAAYVTGDVWSSDFPILNPYQGIAQGSYDVFVTKFNNNGDSLVYSTYLGSSGDDVGHDIAVDASGAAYITGRTSSNYFPRVNSYQGTYQGSYDSFVTKLSSAGNSLVYSTFLGGDGEEWGNGIVVDTTGSAYVTGYTFSTDFPLVNSYQTDQNYADAFVTKFSSEGNSLIYSTYLGGNNHNDYGNGIAIDSYGAAYITGHTSSDDFPTQNSFQDTINGYYDAFITKLDSSGNSLIYSTYLGGNLGSKGTDIAVDDSREVFVTGVTNSTNFPTLNAYQETLHGTSDAFVTKFSSTGDNISFSTYLGGDSTENCYDIVIDEGEAIYVTGETYSSDFPTVNDYQETLGGYSDAFVTKFDYSGNNIIYSTYFGGNNYDHGLSIAIDNFGAVYITGSTRSNNFPTLNPFKAINQFGSPDAFVTKFSPESCCDMRGDVKEPTDGQILVNDLVFLVNYVFKGGPLPTCPEEGDVKSPLDGKILINDLVYLVNTVYKGGPPPPPC